VVIAVAASACNPDAEPERTRELELFTWWTQPGEREALKVLESAYQERYPEFGFSSGFAPDNGEEAVTKLSTAFESFRAPDLIQTNAGSALLSWVYRTSSGASTDLSRLGVLPDRLQRSVDSEVWSAVNPALSDTDGNAYAVPVGVHRLNCLYYNVSRLQAAGVDAPRSLADLRRAVIALRGDAKVFAIAESDSNSTALEHFVFENLLPAVTAEAGQAGFYEDLFRGDFGPFGLSGDERRQLTAVLDLAQELWPDFEDTDGGWPTALERLVDKRNPVAFVMSGDWATAYLRKRGYVQGKDFDVAAFPGAEDIYVYTADVIAITRGGQQAEDATRFLETSMQRDVQLAFSRAKGSIPALELTGEEALDDEQFPAELRERVKQFRAAPLRVMGMSGLVRPDVPFQGFRGVLQDMLLASSAPFATKQALRDQVIYRLRAASPAFLAWSDRVAQSKDEGP
jgi:glucose/mannose transport system substrate-binding protein